jgi:hypothetical protein
MNGNLKVNRMSYGAADEFVWLGLRGMTNSFRKDMKKKLRADQLTLTLDIQRTAAVSMITARAASFDTNANAAINPGTCSSGGVGGSEGGGGESGEVVEGGESDEDGESEEGALRRQLGLALDMGEVEAASALEVALRQHVLKLQKTPTKKAQQQKQRHRNEQQQRGCQGEDSDGNDKNGGADGGSDADNDDEAAVIEEEYEDDGEDGGIDSSNQQGQRLSKSQGGQRRMVVTHVDESVEMILNGFTCPECLSTKPASPEDLKKHFKRRHARAREKEVEDGDGDKRGGDDKKNESSCEEDDNDDNDDDDGEGADESCGGGVGLWAAEVAAAATKGSKGRGGGGNNDHGSTKEEEVVVRWAGLEKIGLVESGANLLNDLNVPFAKVIKRLQDRLLERREMPVLLHSQAFMIINVFSDVESIFDPNTFRLRRAHRHHWKRVSPSST